MATMTSPFGYRTDPVHGGHTHHAGCDFAAPTGTPIYANKDLTIVKSEYNNSGYGNMVVAQDANGNKYTFAHMNNRDVKPGDSIKAGDQLGNTGNTGKSTGPHLHYEVTDANGKKIDPQSTDPSTGRPYTDSVGFEKGKGLNASNATPDKNTKPATGNPPPSTTTNNNKTETTEQKKKREADDKSRKSTGTNQAPRSRPSGSDVGILENPLNKL